MTMQLEASEEKHVELVKILVDKNLYRVFFANEINCLCSEDDILEYHLYKNARISSKVIAQLQEKSKYYECLNDALRLINVKQYAIKQVKDKLLVKEHSEDNIEKVIAYLQGLNLLNDELFYEAYVEFKINQGYGPIYIKNKLFELGINKPVDFSYEQQYNLINREFKKRNKGRDTKSIFSKNFKNRMLNQGFDLVIVEEVLQSNSIATNDDKLKKEVTKLVNKYASLTSYQRAQKIKQRLLSKGYNLHEIETVLKEADINEY